MTELAKIIYQILVDIWKNYKHHLDEFDPKDPSKFWDDWMDDVNVMDAAYENDKVKYIFFQHMICGLRDATKEYINGKTD